MLSLTNLENDKIFLILKFKTLTNFQNLTILKIKHFFYFTIWKINILKFENLLNILSIQIISKKWKNTIIKLSKNSSFVISIFAISKYRSFYISSLQILTPTHMIKKKRKISCDLKTDSFTVSRDHSSLLRFQVSPLE